jgi:hypothetical protein
VSFLVESALAPGGVSSLSRPSAPLGSAERRASLLASSSLTSLIENTIFQWEEGYRRLQAARSDPEEYRQLGRVVVAVEDTLRKRLGSSFSIEELAAVYRQDVDWDLELAMQKVPPRSASWDSSTVVDAAFYLYMREASDFAGGSRRVESAQPRSKPRV